MSGRTERAPVRPRRPVAGTGDLRPASRPGRPSSGRRFAASRSRRAKAPSRRPPGSRALAQRADDRAEVVAVSLSKPRSTRTVALPTTTATRPSHPSPGRTTRARAGEVVAVSRRCIADHRPPWAAGGSRISGPGRRGRLHHEVPSVRPVIAGRQPRTGHARRVTLNQPRTGLAPLRRGTRSRREHLC